ncbi:MAG: DNA polymerase subunit beta, partial [Methanomicrobium sp.]|nr:DNA polymerase subunit beta [Methanomicrobium sp.]
MKPIRLRDFVEDKDGWIYAVSAYDNSERAGCVLRYVPDENGERVSKSGVHYKKYDFEPAFEFIRKHKPQYLDVVHRIPLADIKRVIKPDEEIGNVIARNKRVAKLAEVF